MLRTELSLPAGSLQCALRAFEGGADSVYLGMKSFSARKGAVNFSFEDLRKLKQLCLDRGKKFYITLNTLVDDSALPQVESLLRQLEYLQPDGIIVQDLGIAALIRDRYPSLPLHASTQLAVHTVNGVKAMEKLGFTRVVLSRELSFQEIREIREKCPDVELKVFIHGALCYGFSGLCMASEVLTGRSANCGECAQICRSWFSCNGGPEKFWPFSMKDLCLGHKVLQLQDIGIDSLKIEGRMKSPEYVYHCARYYSMILDGVPADNPALLAEEEAMKIAFARQETEGFFNKNAENLVCSTFPTHMGIRVGTIVKVMKNRAAIRFERPAAVRDGLLVISGTESAGFALSGLENGRSFVSEGQTVTVDFPSSSFTKLPVQGTPVMCTSRHNQTLPLLQENIPLYKKAISIKAVLTDRGLEVNGRFSEPDVSEARSASDIKQIIESAFRSSGDSLFTCGDFEFENKSSYEMPFLPLSQLKKARRDFYAQLDADFDRYCADCTAPEGVRIPEINPEDPNVVRMDALMFDEEQYLASMDKVFQQRPDTLFGLNNVAQLLWAEKHPGAKVFADFFLYVKNSAAWTNLNSFAKLQGRVSSMPTEKIPLFISRVCFRHNALNLPCEGCSKNNSYTLTQGGKTFTVNCRNCITTVFLNPQRF